jgi:hypothetical protein
LGFLTSGLLIPNLLGGLPAAAEMEDVEMGTWDSNLEVGGRVRTEQRREEADESEEVSMLD